MWSNRNSFVEIKNKTLTIGSMSSIGQLSKQVQYPEEAFHQTVVCLTWISILKNRQVYSLFGKIEV